MFAFLQRYLPTSLGGTTIQENVSKRKRDDMNVDQQDELVINNLKKTKPNLPKPITTTTSKKTSIPDLHKKEESTAGHELVKFLEKEKLLDNQIVPTRCNKKKKMKKAKSKVISEKPILKDEVIILDDEDDLKHAYKKLDGALVSENYIQNHSEAIHPLSIHQKINSDIKVPHIPVETKDDKTSKNNQMVKKVNEPEIIRVEPKPPRIISRKLFTNNKDKGATLFRGDQVDRLTLKLDSLLSLREKSEEARITRSFIEKEAINRASTKVVSLLCKELLGEEAKKLYNQCLPQHVYNKLVSEIISETVVKQKEFFPLSVKDLKYVDNIFSKRHSNTAEVLSLKYSIDITWSKIQCLKGTDWLNDEVINFYFNMIKERSEKNPKYPKVHVFSTFFYEKLAGTKYNYGAVKRWTKKIDLLEYDKIIIPIHLSVHWTLAVINLRDNKFEYFDSMNGRQAGMRVMENLEKYLVDEIKDKKGVTYETSSWEKSMPNVPQQQNGSDCGVFTCKFANFASQDLPFAFSQAHMPYFRKRMVLEIVRAKEIL